MKIPPNIIKWMMYAIFSAALLFPFNLTIIKHICVALLIGQLFSQLNNIKTNNGNTESDRTKDGDR